MEWSCYTGHAPGPSHPVCLSTSINKVLVQLLLFFFNPHGIQINLTTPRFIILLSVMFPLLQNIALRAIFFQKGRTREYQKTEIRILYKIAAILIKTSISQLNKRDRDKQPHTYAKPSTCQSVNGRIVPDYPQNCGLRQTNKQKKLQILAADYISACTKSCYSK